MTYKDFCEQYAEDHDIQYVMAIMVDGKPLKLIKSDDLAFTVEEVDSLNGALRGKMLVEYEKLPESLEV